MDAYDLIISVMALNPGYSSAVKNCLNRTELTQEVLAKYPDEILVQARIRPHDIYGHSANLERAVNGLIRNGVLKFWTDNSLSWDFPLTPRGYFQAYIEPKLSPVERSRLEQFARSLR